MLWSQETSEAASLGHVDEVGDGDSHSTTESNNNSTVTSQVSGADHSSSDVGSSGRGNTGSVESKSLRPSPSLEPTPEEDSETDESFHSKETDGTDRKKERTAAGIGGHKSPKLDAESITTASGSDDNNDSGKRPPRRSEEYINTELRRMGGKQPIDVESLPDPSIVDWEVAVVMSSTNADDMVSHRERKRKAMLLYARQGSK